jgi:hypothetical protein
LELGPRDRASARPLPGDVPSSAAASSTDGAYRGFARHQARLAHANRCRDTRTHECCRTTTHLPNDT